MRTLRLALILLLGSAPAWADQTPSEQALGQEIMSQLQGKLNCNTSLIEAQQKIQALEAKLKAKSEEKKQ